MSATHHLHRLAAPEELRRRCQSLAVLDAILSPEWEYRYFSFNRTWGPDESLSSMRNGEGDDWLILWNRHGAILKGFVLDSPMADGSPWPGLLDHVPPEFEGFVHEPAFSLDKTTFCLWRKSDDDSWSMGPVELPAGANPDGADRLLRFLDGDPTTYLAWGEEYFGTRLNPKVVEQVYRHEPLTDFQVRALNKEVPLAEARQEIQEIGYPYQSQ